MLPGFPVQASGALPPVIVERTGSFFANNGTATYNLIVGKSVVVGELLLVGVSTYQNRPISSFTSGWTKVAEFANGQGTITIFSQIATASTVSLSVTYSTAPGGQVSYQLTRIYGANQIAASTCAYIGGTTALDPNVLTLSQARNALWFVAYESTGGTAPTTAWGLPSGYASWRFDGPASGIGWSIGFCYKQAYLLSDDPGAIANRGTDGTGATPYNTDKYAFTIAVWKA